MAQVKIMLFRTIIRCTDFGIRIFRTDYGHTEVAAHFGNGKQAPLRSRLAADELYRPEGILYLNQGIRA
jgi:hypothetical protein